MYNKTEKTIPGTFDGVSFIINDENITVHATFRGILNYKKSILKNPFDPDPYVVYIVKNDSFYYYTNTTRPTLLELTNKEQAKKAIFSQIIDLGEANSFEAVVEKQHFILVNPAYCVHFNGKTFVFNSKFSPIKLRT